MDNKISKSVMSTIFKRNSLALLAFGIIGIIIFITADLSAEMGLDFQIPPPENSEALGAHNLKFGGRDLMGETYKSEDNQYRVATFYSNFFNKAGFKKTFDAKMQGEQTRRIQFRKENLVADIVLTPTPEGTDIGVAKYTLPAGVSRIENLPPSVDDTMFALPQEDAQGEDLTGVPRPPQSVRLPAIDFGDQKYWTYVSKLSVPEIREFYKNEMQSGGWVLKTEIDVDKLTAQYKKLSGKKDLGLGKFRYPVQGAGDLEQAMSQSFVLDFQGDGTGFVKVTITPNILSQKEGGSFVQILYTEKDDEHR